MKRLTVALIAALSSPLVLAVEKPYIGIDYQLGTYTESKFEVEPEVLRLVHYNFALRETLKAKL